MDRSSHARWIVASLLTLVVSAGCGGGGGGGGVGPAYLVSPAFTGSYHYIALGGFTPGHGPEEVLSEFGTAHPDAAGGVTLNWRSNVSGDIEPPAVSDSTRFTVAADGAFGWSVPLSGSTPYVRGGLRGDSRVGVLASSFDTGMPEVRAVLERSGSMDESSLVGEYYSATWRYSPDDGRHESREGTVWFDGSGAWRGGGTSRADGPHGMYINEGWYTLTGPGDLLFSDFRDTLNGGLLDGGSFAILGGASTPGPTYLAALVRRHALGGLGASTFSGSYYVVTFAYTPGGYASALGILTSDGAGGWTLTSEANVEGRLLPPLSRLGRYEVAPFGELTLDLGSGDALQGGVTADGGFACLGAGLTATPSAPPQIWLLVRR